MTIVLMTTNRWKIAEYRRFLARHAQTLVVEQPTEEPEVLATWLDTAKAVLADESNVFDPAGDLVAPTYVGPARNICRLHAWVRAADHVAETERSPEHRAQPKAPDRHSEGSEASDVRGGRMKYGRLVRMSYIREIAGHFEGGKLRPDDPNVFDWDAAFTSESGTTLEEMSSYGLKNSAREQCLSAFAKAFLHHKEPKRLRWTSGADWSADARLLLAHPLYQDLAPPLKSALAFAIDHGLFFRAAKNRRDGNYWFPGLNGGLPYVPKGDPIHEGTYMFHDIMHHLMPDLVFDGADTVDHKRTYIAYRMASEAVSLVLADMLFVEGLARTRADYDFTKRQIYPLYQLVRDRDLRWLLCQVVGFVVRGVPGELPIDTGAWRAFAAKYTRFFVADFQWTRMNWHNLVSRAEMQRAWIALMHAETFRAQGVWFISDVVDRIGRGLTVEALVDRLFDDVWARRIEPALAYTGEPDVARSASAGFRRWLTGQCALFARYAPIAGIPPLGHELAARVRDPRPFDAAEIEAVRVRFAAHVRTMAADGVISDDDAAIFPDLFPLFDPFFLRDYDLAAQEFDTVAEASATALG